MALSEDQEAALRRLVEQGELTDAQAEAVRREFAAAPAVLRVGWLIEVAGYLGGGLILGGAALLLGTQWDRLTRITQAGILAGLALVFVAAALIVAEGRIKDLTGAKHRVVGVLLALASIPAAAAAGVAASTDKGTWAFLVGLAVSLAGLKLIENGLGVAIAAVMSTGAVTSVASEVFEANQLSMGIALLALGTIWTAGTLKGWVRPKLLGFLIGFGLAVVGAQLPLSQTGAEPWAYGLTLAVAAACLAIYAAKRLLAALAGGVVAATLVVPEIVSDVTDGALGGAAILLIAGVVLVATSAVGLRLRKKN